MPRKLVQSDAFRIVEPLPNGPPLGSGQETAKESVGAHRKIRRRVRGNLAFEEGVDALHCDDVGSDAELIWERSHGHRETVENAGRFTDGAADMTMPSLPDAVHLELVHVVLPPVPKKMAPYTWKSNWRSTAALRYYGKINVEVSSSSSEPPAQQACHPSLKLTSCID